MQLTEVDIFVLLRFWGTSFINHYIFLLLKSSVVLIFLFVLIISCKNYFSIQYSYVIRVHFPVYSVQILYLFLCITGLGFKCILLSWKLFHHDWTFLSSIELFICSHYYYSCPFFTSGLRIQSFFMDPDTTFVFDTSRTLFIT